MDSLHLALSWGPPVGIGLWFLFTGAGIGIFLWGLAQLQRYKNGV